MIKAEQTKSKTKPSLNKYTKAMLDSDSRHTKIMAAKMKELTTNQKSMTDQVKPAEPNTAVTKQTGHQTKELRARKGSLTNTLNPTLYEN